MMIESFSIFEPFSSRLVQGMTTRHFGSVSNEEPNFDSQIEKLKRWTGVAPFMGDQTHGSAVIGVEGLTKVKVKADSFITGKKEIPLVVKVADCQGVLMYDPKTHTAAAVHCGWRGSALNIIGKTIQKMKRNYGVNPKDLRIAIGPSIGPCCSEFTDPKNELPEFIHPYIKGKLVDFWKLSIAQCSTEGVPKKQVEGARRCTKCETDAYFSHRNQDSGRMAVFIGLK